MGSSTGGFECSKRRGRTASTRSFTGLCLREHSMGEKTTERAWYHPHGHVKSKRAGRNNFRCCNGHEWRTIPNDVADGKGCPQCGVGQRTSEQTRQAAKPGVLFLLTHPDKPGLVKIELTYRALEQYFDENAGSDWQVHRYRNVEEPALAESLIWELLGHPLPHDREPISIDLENAERVFRQIHYRLESEIALAEKAKEQSSQGVDVDY